MRRGRLSCVGISGGCEPGKGCVRNLAWFGSETASWISFSARVVRCSVTSVPQSDDVLQRMVDAVEKVRQRLLKASGALNAAGIEYAVVDGNAVAAWVATVDEGAVRNTQDVDIMIRREQLPEAKAALEGAGFVYRHAAGMDLFLDHAGALARNAVHVVFSGEMVRQGEARPNPEVSEAVEMGSIRVLRLEALVQIKLTAFRDKDRTHLRDMIGVGLIDGTWPARFGGVLGARLQDLLDTPDG